MRTAQNYEYVVEQQPIGKELFRQFCRGEVDGGKTLASAPPPKSSLDSKTLLEFLEAVVCFQFFSYANPDTLVYDMRANVIFSARVVFTVTATVDTVNN